MKVNPYITVIMLCHRRFRILEDSLKFLFAQKNINQIILLDNSGSYTPKVEVPEGKSFIFLQSNSNLGPGARVPLVGYSWNEKIMFLDDDVELHQGLIEDLERFWNEDTVTGIMGKQFKSRQYLKAKHISGLSITEPMDVEYVPYNCALFHRKWLTRWDLFNCPDYFFMDDLWLSLKIRKAGGRLLAIPTKNYTSAKENNDEGAMWRRKDLHEIRQKWMIEWVFKRRPIP